MKISYIAAIRFPNERAHGIAIAMMCQALVKQKVDLELVVPNRRQPWQLSRLNWQQYYNITDKFPIKKLWSIDFLWLNKFLLPFLQSLTYFLLLLTFQASLLAYLKKNKRIIYTRDFFLAPLLLLFGKKVFFEIHDWPQKSIFIWFHKLLYRKISGIICISKALEKKLLESGIEKSKIIVLPSGVSQNFFVRKNKLLCRKKNNLPINKTIVMYTGSISVEKGGIVFLKTAKIFKKNKNLVFVIVGGNFVENISKEIVKKIKKMPNVIFIQQKPPADMPQLLASADILVLPNSMRVKEKIFKEYTSPIKLYEYMASGKPVIASRIPTLKKIFGNKQALLFFNPDDAESLADKILFLNNNQSLINKLTVKARKIARQNTWAKRAKRVILFMNSRISN